jgi:hypothetical protein
MGSFREEYAVKACAWNADPSPAVRAHRPRRLMALVSLTPDVDHNPGEGLSITKSKGRLVPVV